MKKEKKIWNKRYVCDVQFGVDKELSNEEHLEISRRTLKAVQTILHDMGIPAEHNMLCGVSLDT
jgi:hypothetical protein